MAGTRPRAWSKPLRKYRSAPRVLITNQIRNYAVANRALALSVEHPQHKGLNDRAKNWRQPTRARKVIRHFKSARQRQPFISVHAQVISLFKHGRFNANAKQKRQMRKRAFEAQKTVASNSKSEGIPL